MRQIAAPVLCLLVAGAELFAQPYLASRIVSVRSAETGRLEITVRSEKSGEFDAITPDNAPQFTVTENGRAQSPVQSELLPQNNQVSRTVILADLSYSLTRRQFADFKRAATDFVSRLKPGDLVALVTFHRRVYRELNFTGDRELLKKRISALRQTGKRTMLYDALIEAHKMLRDVPDRKAIVVYTDGRENASRVRFDDLTEVFTAQPVPLFVAGNRKSYSLRKLIRLARVSGGDAFRAEDRHDLGKVFSYLSRLRAQEFRLSYVTRQPPGSAIDLEVRSPQWAQPLTASYTIPHGVQPDSPQREKLFSSALPESIRAHMPEILLSLIVLLLIAVIVMLFFRRQEISVKVENVHPPVLVGNDEIFSQGVKRQEMNRAKLPLDYHHGWLVEKEGPHTGRKYRINWHTVTVGFDDDSSIVIDDNTVSPKHAKIERQGNKFVLYDLLSENGTWLNGRKLLRPKELNDFDEIGIGRTKLIFRKSAGKNEERHGEKA
ncbi:MAG: FHA domain-containing protein [Spirochaetota bacterium]